jgi:hypothetical protein
MTQHPVHTQSQYPWLLPHSEPGNLLNDLGNGSMMNIRVLEMPSEFQKLAWLPHPEYKNPLLTKKLCLYQKPNFG